MDSSHLDVDFFISDIQRRRIGRQWFRIRHLSKIINNIEIKKSKENGCLLTTLVATGSHIQPLVPAASGRVWWLGQRWQTATSISV